MSGLITLPPLFEEKTSPMAEGVLEGMEEDLRKVDHEFQKNLRSDVPIISAIGEHLLQSGGKRFRAKLLLLSAKLCGYSGENHIPMASLIEFIHTATLLHDDVVDNAKLRRGVESANAKWGNEACVLVGDFLFTKCFTRMVESGNWKILHTISAATTLIAEGELEELVKTNDLSLTEETYLSIIARKTGHLMSAATQIGAILGNVSEGKEAALAKFGMDVGIAFQLIDDNLDYTSNKSGKKIGIDLQEGKVTLPLIFTLRRCDGNERTFIHETVNSHPITKRAFVRVAEIIERYRGVHYTWEKAKAYVEKAKDSLRLFPHSKEKEALCTLADYVLERKL
ncbi:MAG TPA: polyprenyl synthetase family protein [Thermodesulfobacteriota bacterium]|jgi:octaprenyl-diphosphate synthase|nr:polyprenyl synthetase family protein [Thermodesulfobacteriota bacterium]